MRNKKRLLSLFACFEGKMIRTFELLIVGMVKRFVV